MRNKSHPGKSYNKNIYTILGWIEQELALDISPSIKFIDATSVHKSSKENSGDIQSSLCLSSSSDLCEDEIGGTNDTDDCISGVMKIPPFEWIEKMHDLYIEYKTLFLACQT